MITKLALYLPEIIFYSCDEFSAGEFSAKCFSTSFPPSIFDELFSTNFPRFPLNFNKILLEVIALFQCASVKFCECFQTSANPLFQVTTVLQCCDSNIVNLK